MSSVLNSAFMFCHLITRSITYSKINLQNSNTKFQEKYEQS